MATTTNYSWTTPDDTALVKDGAAAIRSLGTAIDSTVFTNAGNAIAKTIVDAKGDIIAATAADTVSRLAVGANDTVLMADSSTATGLKWGTPSGGGMTLISTTTLSGATTTLSSIPQTYKNLQVIIKNAVCSNAADPQFKLTGSSTTYVTLIGSGGTQTFNNGTFAPGGTTSYPTSAFTVFNYTDTTTHKTVIFSSSQGTQSVIGSMYRPGNAAIDSIEITIGAGTWSSGTVLLYGVN